MKDLIIGLLGVTILAAAVAAHGDELDQAISLARKTLAFVQGSRPCPDLAAELARWESRSKGASADSTERAELCAAIRRLRRRILLSHPLLDFDRLLVNKCPPPGYVAPNAAIPGPLQPPRPRAGRAGVLERPAAGSAAFERQAPGGLGDASRFVVRCAARRIRVLRSYAARPELAAILSLGSGRRRQPPAPAYRRTADRTAGAEGRETALIEDFDPCYLPDGGIAFVSTRSQTHIRCQYGFRYFANFLLYRADGDGSNIRPLSFAEAPEWKPSVLDDGRILYSRWDYTNRHSYHFQSLWVTRPDGTGTANVYGNLTRNPCNTGEPRQVPGSHKIVCTATAHHGYTAGSIILVDPRKGIDGLSPITRITPEIAFPETEGWPVGAFATPFPLSEDLFLAAYTPEPLVREGNVQSEAAYGIYLVDTPGWPRVDLPRRPGVVLFAYPVAASSPAAGPAASRTGGGSGDGRVLREKCLPVDARPGGRQRQEPARRAGLSPDGGNAAQPQHHPLRNAQENLGNAPVAADGSAAFRAPARQPLLFQLLDRNGMALMTMRSLVYLQPGERVSCVGCHEPRNMAPERPALAAAVQIHDLEPPAGPSYEGGLSFARTVQPVLDRYCIGCHGLDRAKATWTCWVRWSR